MFFAPPPVHRLEPWSSLPGSFRRRRRSAWADLNLGGDELECFLEGPAFDALGNLYVVDIPFGRVFRITPGGEWTLVAEYDGWPNGLKVAPDGRLMIADQRLGLVRVDPATGTHEVLLEAILGEPLLGLNDLTYGPDGLLYVTDQGQTGLHDPRGRVLRIRSDGEPQVVLTGGPSPNGLIFDRARPWLFVAMTRANAIWRVPLVDGQPTKVGVAIQLSGGIGPDGLALDSTGNLFAAHPLIGVWRFDARGRPTALYRDDETVFPTNLAIRRVNGRELAYVTDSLSGRVVTANLAA